ncbi:Uncharacterized protein B5E38_2635 [Bacillus cereus]|nr:Uncharacterized protein B5E38_2635 [Bacillus cereus]ARO65493.1 Uncharacterized protein B5E39_3158 [Bacillus cereus]
MKFYFITRLYGIELDRVTNKGMQTINGMRISNSKERLNEIIDNEFKISIGKLDYDQLYSGCYLYREGELPKDFITDYDSNLRKLIDKYSTITNLFCTYLWYLKDNAVSSDSCFLYIKDPSGKFTSFSSNNTNSMFYSASCKTENKIFTKEEINSVTKFAEKIFSQSFSIDKELYEISDHVIKEANRLERFYYFLQPARKEVYLPSRIAMYCTLLETLLSTDNSEVTHKISERLALLLGESYDDRIEIFSFVKKAYSIRSATVHGGKITRTLRDLKKQEEISNQFDGYLRKLIYVIYSNLELRGIFREDDNAQMNEWFNRLILSDKPLNITNY